MRPATALAAMTRTEMRAGGFVPSSPSGAPGGSARRPVRRVAGASPVRPSAPSSLDPDSTFEDYLDHDDDADASFGSPWGTPAKKEEEEKKKRAAIARELRSSILGPRQSGPLPGRAGASRGGSTKAWRKAPDVQVRLTKKAAALAEKNRPIREWRERGREIGGVDDDGYFSARPATATAVAAGGSTAGVVGDRDRVRPATAAAAMDYGGLWGDDAYDMGGWTRGSKL